MKLLILLAFFTFTPFAYSTDLIHDEDYKETLSIKQLSDGQVYFHFEFKTVRHQDLSHITWANHYNLFPLSIGKIVAKHQLQEFHFSLTKGTWKYHRWGYPLRDAPSGAELWIWVQQMHHNPAKSWKDVTSELSGQFCASINFIDGSATVQPKHSMRPQGVVDGSFANDSLFYAALPHEAVCTENLTPWKKLLPCFGRAGLAGLLNSGHVFNSFYHSLAIDFRPICRNPDCKSTSVELVQSISLVFNPPVMFEGKQSWSLIKLFGSTIAKTCSLAKETTVFVDVTHNNTINPVKLQPPPTKIINKQIGNQQRTLAVFNVEELIKNLDKQKPTLNIGGYYSKNFEYPSYPPPPLYSNRFITGFGLSEGGIKCIIHNNHNFPVPIVYLDIIPWYLRMFIHSLKIETSDGNPIEPKSVFYKPAKDRVRPHHLELVMTLPPKSVVQIFYEFDRVFLKWTEYPPDAFHGVYVDSSIISAVVNSGLNMTMVPKVDESVIESGRFLRIHAETLLVSLPTPDFSMPYNVICLVSTVVSLAFGPIHNLTTRRAKVIEDDKKEKEKQGIFEKLKKFFKKDKTQNTSNLNN